MGSACEYSKDKCCIINTRSGSQLWANFRAMHQPRGPPFQNTHATARWISIPGAAHIHTRSRGRASQMHTTHDQLHTLLSLLRRVAFDTSFPGRIIAHSYAQHACRRARLGRQLLHRGNGRRWIPMASNSDRQYHIKREARSGRSTPDGDYRRRPRQHSK